MTMSEIYDIYRALCVQCDVKPKSIRSWRCKAELAGWVNETAFCCDVTLPRQTELEDIIVNHLIPGDRAAIRADEFC